MKVVALHSSFQNQLEFCSKVLPLLRYEVKDFQKCCVVFFIFCVFLKENNTKQHDFNIFRKLREGATTIVSWENSFKKQGAYPKWDIDTERLQKITNRPQTSNIDYKVY